MTARSMFTAGRDGLLQVFQVDIDPPRTLARTLDTGQDFWYRIDFYSFHPLLSYSPTLSFSIVYCTTVLVYIYRMFVFVLFVVGCLFSVRLNLSLTDALQRSIFFLFFSPFSLGVWRGTDYPCCWEQLLAKCCFSISSSSAWSVRHSLSIKRTSP